ncbi:MAG: HD domain-containing protein [Candidatus Acetothermia bacterium]
MEFNVPIRGNTKLEKVVQAIADNSRLQGFWEVANKNAVDRLSINDHGPVHSKIVANSALRIFRLFREADLKSSLEKDYELGYQDAEVIILLSSALHDLGHVVHRRSHEEFAIPLASGLIGELVGELYSVYSQAIIEGETLHAIYAHKTGVEPLTLEAGILKVADALDMAEGRARIPFNEGEVTIHSVSALSIDGVSISKGESKPVRVVITMSNSAGIFQVDNLFKRKLLNSTIADQIEIKVRIVGDGEQEKSIIEEYEI